MEIKTLEKIFKICVLIALISVLFDISVTYTFYKKDVNNFLIFEGHRRLVGELKEGIPFFQTISIGSMLLIPIILFFIVTSLQIFSKKIYKINLIMMIPLLLIASATHFFGGLSWLI